MLVPVGVRDRTQAVSSSRLRALCSFHAVRSSNGSGRGHLDGGMMRHPDVRHPDVLSKYVRPQANSFQVERESEPDSGSRSASATGSGSFSESSPT